MHVLFVLKRASLSLALSYCRYLHPSFPLPEPKVSPHIAYMHTMSEFGFQFRDDKILKNIYKKKKINELTITKINKQ